ncbi:hypothetical protein SKAU_G00115860 [Synaphobranchus kaupii]|uniref:Uncharacterized protein n=1 Tax=Synaphobranchus kaupii TaxID=118154 RepID=A0A9Q1FML9_SYNKA|nr:hypothetical protein SKAU_G00115860 [Synaphobranchus kaupii]
MAQMALAARQISRRLTAPSSRYAAFPSGRSSYENRRTFQRIIYPALLSCVQTQGVRLIQARDRPLPSPQRTCQSRTDPGRAGPAFLALGSLCSFHRYCFSLMGSLGTRVPEG